MPGTLVTRDTPLDELRRIVTAERHAVAPLPNRLRIAAQRHERAREKNWNLSDVIVTNDGRIMVKQDAAEETVSRVTTQIFAAFDMNALETQLAAEHLPANARKHGAGWAYTVENEFGDVFDLYLCFDHYLRQYRVLLVNPAIESMADAHRYHIYSDGHLCLSPGIGGGERMFTNAYAESVLWCNGFGSVIRGHGWPWGE